MNGPRVGLPDGFDRVGRQQAEACCTPPTDPGDIRLHLRGQGSKPLKREPSRCTPERSR
jgi:hypothetical protein